MTLTSGEFPIEAQEVAETFNSYDPVMRAQLMELRALIFLTANETSGVGHLEEALRWGQPSYITTHTHSGSTIRIAPTKTNSSGDYAMYFICNTDLISRFRTAFGDTFTYETNRAILFSTGSQIPVNELRQCIAMALTYHLTPN